MSKIKILGFIAVIGCFLALTAQISSARGPAAHSDAHHSDYHGHSDGHHHSDGNDHQASLPSFANSWPYLRAENGIQGPIWAAPGPGSNFGFSGSVGGGFGGAGFGGGFGGWGYGLSDFGYYPQNVPYFNLFPPVYYSYADGAIVPTSTLRSSWTGDAGQPATEQIPPPPQPAPAPLMIVNPYYSAGK